MSDDTLRELLEVQARFRLPSVALVEKDLHVVRAIAALAAIDAAPFALVFGGGTALARAHKLVRRMSEDVDFKIVPTPAAAVSRSGLHRQRSALRGRVTAALRDAGFAFDPRDPAQARSRDESSYTIYQLPYDPVADGDGPGGHVALGWRDVAGGPGLRRPLERRGGDDAGRRFDRVGADGTALQGVPVR